MPLRLVVLFFLFCISCLKSQEKDSVKKRIGGPCDGCEAIYEYGNKDLKSVDTIPGFVIAKDKLKITGTIYKNDGKTPAKDVILYAYHTNEKGVYPKKNTSMGWEKRHGYLRGWIKTDISGKYTLYTFRPASYPNTTIPQHIHITLKEPDKNEYYIDDFYFADDPNLTDRIKNRTNFRGGSGIVKPVIINSMQVANRDIILGKNIPNYN